MNKPFVVMISIIGGLALLIAMGVGGYFYIKASAAPHAPKPPSSSELKDLRVDLPTMTTNLKDGLIQFAPSFEVQDKSAKQALIDLQPVVQDAVNRAMREYSKDDLTAGSGGYDKLVNSVKDNVNRILPEGKVTAVYFSSIVVQ